MTPLKSVAFIGNSLPRKCGIATFTTDLHQAVSASRAQLKTCIVAMNDRDEPYLYPPHVCAQIRDPSLALCLNHQLPSPLVERAS